MDVTSAEQGSLVIGIAKVSGTLMPRNLVSNVRTVLVVIFKMLQHRRRAYRVFLPSTRLTLVRECAKFVLLTRTLSFPTERLLAKIVQKEDFQRPAASSAPSVRQGTQKLVVC